MKEIIKNKKNIAILLLFIVISILLESSISIYSMVKRMEPFCFDFSRWFFILGFFASAYIIYLIKNKYLHKYEIIFLLSSLIIGTTIVLCTPFGHPCWDFENHFESIVSMAPGNTQTTIAEEKIINADYESWFAPSWKLELDRIEEINRLDSIKIDTTYNSFQIPHIPGAILYGITKIIGIPIYIRIKAIQFLYMILYSLICYFGIKRLKTKKLLVSTIALFPTSIFLASNITYDWWVIAFTILGFSVFFSEMQQPEKPISIWTTILMCLSLTLACLPKQIYFPLLIIPFFLKKDSFKGLNKHRAKYFSVIIIFLIILMASFMIRSGAEINSGGDQRGGNNISPTQQIDFILNNPADFLKVFFIYITSYINIMQLPQITSSFANIGDFANISYGIDFGAAVFLTIFVLFVDKNKYDTKTSTKKLRIIVFGLSAIVVCFIGLAMYLSFTPVGFERINGCQPRYLIPLLIPMLQTITFKKITASYNPHNLILGVSSCWFLIFFWNMFWIITKIMM